MIDHPDLDRLIEKHLPKANVRPAKDIVENLKAKVGNIALNFSFAF